MNIGWDFVIASVLAVIWLIRLEAKVLYMEKDNARYREESLNKEEKLWEKIDNMTEKMQNILTALAKLEGYISNQHDNKNN